MLCSGLHGETLVVDEQHYVVKAFRGKAKMAKQWAAMRLLLELGHHIDPAFFSDTPEGLCFLIPVLHTCSFEPHLCLQLVCSLN